MEQARYKIFVSSTTDDLKAHRASAVEAVQRLGHEAVVVEFAEASDQSPLQHSREVIASCDALISLVAHRYGFVPKVDNPNQHSFVELELRYAWELHKPTFVFMVNDDVPWPARFIDRDTNGERLQKFRKEVLDRVVVAFFGSPADLAQKVTEALARFRAEHSDVEPPPFRFPAGVDPFELAWRLVVDFKAEPALLAGMDAAEVGKATKHWALETLPDEPLEGPRLFEFAQAQLRSKQASIAPSPLWLAWKRAAAAAQRAPQANE